ncbi:hypothetical protein FB45DRAFT_517148 [Roridomyces roridus]|uniref:Uncharacterized protein n=1 Tax=Roridomyces roridus TaxID=1738132 RepID=A0AAD7BYC4_9AGAR|nr:hypothetical protein FB45DRAFT_517148 [Roridomyces roridus]
MHQLQLPDSFVHGHERSEMLDRLSDLPLLKGFPEMEESPTSATMSLPTPPCAHVPLPRESMEVPPNMPISYLFPNANDDAGIICPDAPRMKDYDSFTEGSAKGSFDSIPAAETNEFGEPVYPISAPALAALPTHNAALSIEQWRQDVDESLDQPTELPPMRGIVAVAQEVLPTIPTVEMSESEAGTTPTNTKRPRPRSNTSEDNDERRNRRARAASPPSPSPRVRARAQSCSSASSGIMNSFLWVDRGPPPNIVHVHLRPPSRANSAPPD